MIFLIFTDVTVIDIIDNSPSFDFNPPITLVLTALYGSLSGGLFAFISLRSRIRTFKEPVKDLIPIYPFYLGFTLIGGCCLIFIGFIIIFDPVLGSMWPCLRMFLSSTIYLIFLWFPTMESMFEIFFQSRMDRIETVLGRDKVLDIIDHDLANVTQILHTYFETIQLSDQEREFLKKQVDRMNKLITESRAIVIHEDDMLVQELMRFYKSTRVQNNLLDKSKTKKEA
ncbi:MAG: hypothetical protein JSW11_11430 [Candidatus Heimdallarchaeota archaeon]|nr:MAG: hypothetical protein JSW11_11430 [Candidatus Heimdallarchaeota archaeon]